ncbi:FlgB family protein [Poseidonocella sedimentorum]|uniref:Flagellar basal-body rod protein FlgB n=1 Tax=Poseidonocella sedimentorum TaxID=871652 RepID=A0A1I6D5Q1_9RHOB|nr:FlgB family protein [Poseidonocella sedimentorum]SFR00647.1 flagellar basal-body rod protein FlgB [Poseidonocella sedimentorum]
MHDTLKVFRLAHAMATHAGTTQSVISTNVANADTPGFKAKKTTPFEVHAEGAGSGFVARATRAQHFGSAANSGEAQIVEDENGANSLNDNNVVIELEMLKAVEANRQHERALSIYRHGMSVIRSSIGRG